MSSGSGFGRMVRVLNCTPHAVRVVLGPDHEVTFAPAGPVPRVTQSRQPAGEIDTGRSGWPVIPCYRTVAGEVTGLPAQEDRVLLIVSAQVRLALPERTDLLSPGEPIRDDKGQVVGCRSFDRN